MRPAILNGSEYWASNEMEEIQMLVTKMRILRWMYDVTILWGIRNEYIRSLQIINIAGKIGEIGLRWFDHLKRRNIKNIVKKTREIKIDGN